MSFYSLMHENTKIAGINIVDNNIVSVYAYKTAKALFPVGYTRDSCGIIEFLRSRLLSADRGVDEAFSLMLKNHGLSLTDHYWLKKDGEGVNWDSINAYVNDFRSSVSLDTCDSDGRNPSYTLSGSLPKKWVIDEDGARYLLKGNRDNSCRQSLAEVFASEIHRRQGMTNYVPYQLVNISTSGVVVTGCSCRNFTSLDTEFVPAIDICNMSETIPGCKKPNDINWYQYYIKMCGLDIQFFMDYMFMTDFVITNTDRHLNNLGVVRNSKTLEFIGAAPIFDSGNSLFYNFLSIPKGGGLLNIPVTSFKKKEVDMLKFVSNRGAVNLSLLPSDNDLYNLLSKDANASREHIVGTVEAYVTKIRLLSDFQNGADIWSYKYKQRWGR